MKNIIGMGIPVSILVMGFFFQCQVPKKNIENNDEAVLELLGYQSLADYGKHLVMISGCHDCHTPRKMGPLGPELDMDLELSGHPSQLPLPEIDRKELESKGIVATSSPTAWIGPWGVSFAPNLTSDESGTGTWTLEQFSKAIREGKWKGLENTRQLLPPMPWEMYGHMNEWEVKAIYSYLKTTVPIKNIAPNPIPPSHIP